MKMELENRLPTQIYGVGDCLNKIMDISYVLWGKGRNFQVTKKNRETGQILTQILHK